jgi:hypothetical protein
VRISRLSASPSIRSPSRHRRQARAWLKTGIEALTILAVMISVDKVNAAMSRLAEVIVRAIEQLPGGAEDLASAVARDGVNGARTFLRTSCLVPAFAGAG